jgi:DNA-binding transcriptional ArsR family regulator
MVSSSPLSNAPLKFLDFRNIEYYRSVMEPNGNGLTSIERLDAVFAALSDSTRRALLARLAAGPATVAELAEPFAMTQPAISKHLKVLETAGLIARDRDAQRRPSRLIAGPLAEASQWFADYRLLWKEPVARKESSARKPDSNEEAKQKKKKKNKHKKH